ncbi:PAS domain-containing protein [Roseibium aestuarii]|uniref:PAS domain-containing protein n=1 Tax=Roseibium aestuarii TaxID=2600299 RepID=A0ABW4JW70_9HYPH|nr:PAS domain-containing protein [Roseibium aestuarii]
MTTVPAPKMMQPAAPETESAEDIALPISEKPNGLTLAGLQFFIADINRKTILWHEIGSQSFDSRVRDIQEAPLSEALGLLTQEDKRTILRLVQGAIRDGKAGPFDVGGGADHRIPGIPLVAYRYPVSDNRILAICFPSIGEDDANPGNIALGLAPILQHFVASTNRIVLLVDNFGYVRFASEGFIRAFGISDIKLVLGRNIAHVQKRVGRTIVSLCIASLTRRASATGRGKFLLASGDTLELAYNAMHFRIGGSFGGVLFSAGQIGGDTDFAKVFNLASAPMMVVNIQTRMIVAANQSAMKTYHLTQEIMDTQPITETLLHPKSYSTLLQTAQQGSDVPQSVVVNSLNGQSKKKRLKAVLLEDDKAPKLMLEARS